MIYNLIGTGNMAWFMAAQLQAAGHTCAGIWGRNRLAAAELANAFHMPLYENIHEIHDGVDACILAVSDKALPDVAAALNFRSTVLVHTAGSVSMEVLAANAQNTAVLWPVFSILKNDLPAHRHFTCVVDFNNDISRKIVHELAAALSDQSYEAVHSQRIWLHITAIMSNNFVNFLMTMGHEICAANNLPYNIMLPMLQQTLDRATNNNPGDMQTGPAKRGDEQTIAAHKELLASNADWLAIYTAFSNAIGHKYGAA